MQLVPTWELADLVGQTRRTFDELAYYSYPPAHWAELAVPGLFRSLVGGGEAPYWFTQHTTGFEACLFVGTVPLLLAVIGAVAGGRGLNAWRVAVPLSFAVATMPRWWPQGYALLLQLPGLGYFRCPARYTVITSFGLALLAGRGLDQGITPRRFRAGLLLAFAFMLGAFAWTIVWTARQPKFRVAVGGDLGIAARLGLAALTWGPAFWVVARTKRGQGERARMVILLTAVEMGAFYYVGGTTRWGWSVPLPESSPVLKRLASEPRVGRVGGPLDNLPVRVGLTTATPYTGFPLPPPDTLLKGAVDIRAIEDPATLRWLRRLGVTHLVSDTPRADRAGGVVFRGADLALDLLAYRSPGLPEHRQWRVVRVNDVFPEARVALRAVAAADRAEMVDALSARDAQDEAWFLPGDVPPENSSVRTVGEGLTMGRSVGGCRARRSV